MKVFAADVTSLRFTEAARWVVRIRRSLAVMIESLPDDRNIRRPRHIHEDGLTDLAKSLFDAIQQRGGRNDLLDSRR